LAGGAVNEEQLAINSVSTIRAGLVPSLRAYSAAGFRNVEFPLNQVREHLQSGHTLSEFQELLARLDLCCIGGFDCAVECFSSAERQTANHARIVDNARFLAQLGAKTMVVGTDGPEDLATIDDPIGRMATVFAELADTIAETGIIMCIEFNWSPFVKSLRTAAEIARRAERTNVGVVFDPAHYHCTPTKFDQLTPNNVAKIYHVHVDDMRDKPAELSNCNSDRVLPGRGILDLQALFSRIEACGYQGYYAIEMFSEELWALPVEQATTLMYESMLALCHPAKLAG
jgi:sugar phosphate isomerase/epimerase